MGKKKKPFIDKKSAHSFQLVHRSQRDPLQADEDSSKHVLVSLDSEAQGATGQDKCLTKSDQLEKRKEYGIDFDDDYDYMQHLKTRTDCTLEPLPDNITVIENKKKTTDLQFGRLQLPSEAFASEYEEKEGLLNLAAPAPGPHPDWDPDIVAALDGAFDENDPNNTIEDDFFIKANEPLQDNDDSDGDLIRSDDDGDDDDERYFPSDEGEDFDGHSEGSGFSFGNDETKSRFTSYSMTSSVIRRNEGLTLLDDRFEKVMEEYDEDEIGALDHEEMTGTVNPDSKILNVLAEEFQQHIPKVRFADTELKDTQSKKESSAHQRDDEDDSDGNDEMTRIDLAPKDQWDCESILSTYSNLYNHPTLIKETPKNKTIKLSSKTGIPLGVLPGKQTTKNNNDCPEDMDTDTVQLHQGPRPRHEDKEDKAQRKRAVKEQRRARRVEKKTNKLTFKAEQKRQEQSLLNTKHQQGQKL